MSIRIGVKFCGNCNPRINSIRVLNQVKMLVSPEYLFGDVFFEGKDVLLVFSGCPTDCAERPAFIGPLIKVAGETLESLPCPAERLAEGITQLLNDLNTRIY